MDTRSRLLPLLTFLTFAGIACHETLPTRIEPRSVFEGSVRMRYEYDRFRNRLRFDVTVKNVFDETISDTIGAFQGTLTVWVARAPQFRQSIPITVDLIQNLPMVDMVRGTLTLDPGDSVFFQLAWDLATDADSTILRDSVLHWRPDPTCGYRVVADREVAVADLDLTMFAPLQNVYARGSIPFCFYDQWVETSACPLPNVLLNGCPHEN